MRSKTSVFVIITSPAGEVIMLDRRDPIYLKQTMFPANLKELPGGAMDENEAPQRAAIRETYEETGNLLDESRLVQVGLFKKAQKCAYFFHYQTTQEEFDEMIQKTQHLFDSFWHDSQAISLYPEAVSEHRNIRRYKMWDVFALANDTPKLWGMPEYPPEIAPNGVTCRFILSLHADVVIFLLAKEFGNIILHEIQGHEHEIAHELKTLVSPTTRPKIDELIIKVKNTAEDRGRDFRGTESDFSIEVRSTKGASFEYV